MSNSTEILPTSPDWSTAPDWAQYHAIDQDGTKTWYSECPVIEGDIWNNASLTLCKMYGCSVGPYPNWKNSLQQRPKNEQHNNI